MRRTQRTATESPRPADIATTGDTVAASELPRLDDSQGRSQPDYEEVARRAYERYESRGRENGRDMEDWLEAERELRQSTSPRGTRSGSGSVRVTQ